MSASTTVTVSEPKHPDFEKILKQFVKRYGKERGERFYYAWLNKHELDDTKPYGSQRTESFQWAKPVLQAYKEHDDGFTYWKVEAAFPLASMNRNVYTEAELKASARTIIGKPLSLNHDVILESDLAKIVDAEYEDGAVEVLIAVAKDGYGTEINQKISDGLLEKPPESAIIHVSLEADCKRGVEDHPEGRKCSGLVFTGLAMLDKSVLPGIPLTRIYAAECFTDEFEKMVAESAFIKEQTETKVEAKTMPEGTANQQAVPAPSTPPSVVPQAGPEPSVAGTSGSPHEPTATAQATVATASIPEQPSTVGVTYKVTTTDNTAGITTPIYTAPQDATPQGGGKIPEDGASGKGSGEAPKEPDAPKQPVKGEPMTPTQPDTRSTDPQGQGGFSASPPAPAEDPQKIPEPTDAILTEPGFWDRFNLYHKTHGFSRQDSFRLTSMDILRHVQKGKK